MIKIFVLIITPFINGQQMGGLLVDPPTPCAAAGRAYWQDHQATTWRCVEFVAKGDCKDIK